MSFLEMKCNTIAKKKIETKSLTNYWAKYTKYMHVHENIGTAAVRRLLSFSSTYLRGSGFFTLLTEKTKHRNKLDQSRVICHKATN